MHAKVSGVADLRFKNERDCFEGIRKLMSLLPQSNLEKAHAVNTGDDKDRLDEGIAALIPEQSNKAYDMRKVIARIADNAEFFEIKPEFAGEIIVGLCRLAGETVGIVANQPTILAGSLSADSSVKEARFIRFCDAFNIPLVMLIDTPARLYAGISPGTQRDYSSRRESSLRSL